MAGDKHFWNIRARNYDRLYWTKDAGYIKKIIDVAGFTRGDLVLDIGTGTGTMARSIQPYVKHVVGMDFSDSMLKRGRWDGISMVKWDITDGLFRNHLFDKIVGRMVFHHILDNLDRAFLRCYDLLKSRGKLIIAEGVPPGEDPDIVEWYTEMFKHKETRRTFTKSLLVGYFVKNGFKDVRIYKYKMRRFNINNWLVNSGLHKAKQTRILNLHRDAPEKVKAAYRMTIEDGICFVDTDNVIVVGRKD
jgi:ubiquinone/menaquinone biosynthesis C-methylase UbiE